VNNIIIDYHLVLIGFEVQALPNMKVYISWPGENVVDGGYDSLLPYNRKEKRTLADEEEV
jgi:hypothetical protein